MSKDIIILFLAGLFIIIVAGFAIDAAFDDYKSRRP